jgi:RNA polymerase sigma factor (sigma-70 family)
VWRELLVRLPSFRLDPKRGKFDTWLYAVVRSKAADFLRRRYGAPGAAPSETPDDRSYRQADPLAAHEDQELLCVALARLRAELPEPSYEVLHLRLVEQRPVAEVAEKLGLSAEQVWYRCHRARYQLRRTLRDLRVADANAVMAAELSEKTGKTPESAQGGATSAVSRINGRRSLLGQEGCAVDFVLKRLELGRQSTNPEWKVEWKYEHGPEPTLYIRKLSMVAYAEICGPEEVINAHWPQIANAAMAAGVAAGVATIMATPTLALSVFRSEFCKHLCAKTHKEVSESLRVALSTQQEPNGPWGGCRE